MEFFVVPGTDEQWHQYWIDTRLAWYKDLGINSDRLRIYEHPKDAAKGKALVDFLRWGYSNGEAVASSLDYSPLPAPMVKRLQTRLNTIGGGR